VKLHACVCNAAFYDMLRINEEESSIHQLLVRYILHYIASACGGSNDGCFVTSILELGLCFSVNVFPPEDNVLVH
jgi:hypothetical protein